MFIETWILASVFAPLAVGFLVAVVALLWSLSGVKKRVELLEGHVDRYAEHAAVIAALKEKVTALDGRVERESLRDAEEHKALAGGIREVTGHLLDIKRMNGSARAKR